jgi:hypothetical protein
VLIILLLFFLVFPSKISAIPTVTINSAPDVVTAGTTFPVTFTINEASSSASYVYKFFGGVDSDVSKITGGPDLFYTSSWVNFPQVTLSSGISNVFSGYAFIKPDALTSVFNLKIKIALTTNTNTGFTSPSFLIDVIAASPTQTPTMSPTLIPTSTPIPINTPTSTIKPTATPTIDLNKYTPSPNASVSAVLEPTETVQVIIPTQEPTIISIEDSGLVLGEDTSQKNILPLIFICLGGLFLLTPLIIAKIKSRSNEKNN